MRFSYLTLVTLATAAGTADAQTSFDDLPAGQAPSGYVARANALESNVSLYHRPSFSFGVFAEPGYSTSLSCEPEKRMWSGEFVPPVITKVIACSTVQSRKTRSSIGTTSMYPEVGFGEVGT